MLSYTWSAISPLDPGVLFSVNGTNAASETTATFTRAGTYDFQVAVTAPGGLTATSDVTVTVNHVLTSIAVSPANVTLAAGATENFSAQSLDQFGNPSLLPLAAFTWSLASGIGSIDPTTGLYAAPDAGGKAVVKASVAGFSGTASVTINPPKQAASLDAMVHFTDSDDWRTGFVGDIMITNTGSNPIGGWTIQFDFAPKVISIWGATIASRIGDQYTIDNVSYDATIAPGQSISFGFEGKPGRAQAGPGDLILNGEPVAAFASVRNARRNRHVRDH